MVGTGAAFPRDVHADALELDNTDVARFLGVPLSDRPASFGVERRQWCALPGRGPGPVRLHDLAAEAGRRALAAAGVGVDGVDLLLVATSTPDRATSSLAAKTGLALGFRGACVDVRGGGAGGLMAWVVAATWLAASPGKALVVAAEIASAWLDPADRDGAFLYADGAAALVVSSGRQGGLVGARLGVAAAAGTPFTVPGPLPPIAGAAYTFQVPDAAYVAALRALWADAARGLREDFPDARIDHFAPYPVTRSQVRDAALALGVPLDRTTGSLGGPGGRGGAGALRGGHGAPIARGEGLAALAVAGGLVHAGVLWRW